MAEPVSSALIGCGRIGAQTSDELRARLPNGWLPLSHAEAMQSVPQVDLRALCDKNPANLESTGKKFGIDALFTDHKEMLESVKPALVSIATRTPDRPQLILDSIEGGVSAMHIEKPIARCLRDCNDLLLRLREKRIHVTYGTSRRYMRIYRQVKEIVQSGEIGDLQEIAIDHGASMLLWAHPHSVDLLLYFAGTVEVKHVSAQCQIPEDAVQGDLVDTDPIVENAYIKFADGVKGLITSMGGMNTRIAGTKGVVEIVGDGSYIVLHRQQHTNTHLFLKESKQNAETDLSGTQQAFTELAQAHLGKRPVPGIRYEEIAAGLNLLLAITLSALRGGVKVMPSEVEQDFTVTGRSGDLYA